MHLPEAPMRTGELRGLGRAFGIRVDLRQRKVAEREAKALAEMVLHGFDDGISKTASRALIVPIFDERGGGVRITLNVVGGAAGTCRTDMAPPQLGSCSSA